MWYINLVEKNIIPDALIRFKINQLLKQRIKEEESVGGIADRKQKLNELVEELKTSPIAINTADANEQHYEVPTEFYQQVLGKHMKYSCGYWQNGAKNQDEAEKDMLELTSERAALTDGQEILELGCGWGSLTLFMAEKFPNSQITAVSNSATQKEHIDQEAVARSLSNVRVITADINDFDIEHRFDRVVSVEMFEHMRNYDKLLKKVNTFLKDDGKLFVHIFTHKELAYKYEVKDESDWMSKYFFTGGIMPSDHLLYYFNDDMAIKKHWIVNGTNYEKTSNEWLAAMDKNKKALQPLFEETYTKKEATRWWVYWRLFFMACAELWGYKGGEEWMVSHYLFEKQNQLSN